MTPQAPEVPNDSESPANGAAKPTGPVAKPLLSSRFNFNKFGLAVVALALAVSGTVYVFRTRAATAPTVAAPTQLALNDASTTAAALRWTASKTAGATYQILRNGVVVGTTDTYTTNYLDSGLSPQTKYSYAIQAVKAARVSTPSPTLAVTTAQTAISIDSCGATIAQSGAYVLASDLSFTSNTWTSCITLSSVSHVSVDCQGHTINIHNTEAGATFFSLDNVSNFLLTNCSDAFSGDMGNAATATDFQDFSFTTASDGTVESNNFGASYTLYGNTSQDNLACNSSPCGANVIFNHNNFVDAWLQQYQYSNNYIGHNHFTWSSPIVIPGSINPQHGTGNVVASNTISDDGRYEGVDDRMTQDVDNDDVTVQKIDHDMIVERANASYTGVDDGILLGSFNPNDAIAFETNDTVVHNTIDTVFDCGIEAVGAITGTTISGNVITNAAASGICSYWNTSWRNDIVSNNRYTSTTNQGSELLIFYDASPVPAGKKIYFQNNRLTSNTFHPGANNGTYGAYINFATQSPYLNSSNSVLKNNLFQDNNLSHTASMYPPIITPSSLIVDGGGNICNNHLPNGKLPKLPNGITCN